VDKNIFRLGLTMLAFVGLIGLSGCTQPAQSRSTPTFTEPAPIPTDTPTPVQPAPSATYTTVPAATYTPTLTLELARISPIGTDVSCRFGPGDGNQLQRHDQEWIRSGDLSLSCKPIDLNEGCRSHRTPHGQRGGGSSPRRQ